MIFVEYKGNLRWVVVPEGFGVVAFGPIKKGDLGWSKKLSQWIDMNFSFWGCMVDGVYFGPGFPVIRKVECGCEEPCDSWLEANASKSPNAAPTPCKPKIVMAPVPRKLGN